MQDKKKIVAISTSDNKVAIVKNVTEKEYNELLKKQEIDLSAHELTERAKKELLDKHTQAIKDLYDRDLLLAKSIYDNFVDRGLLENDDSFQNMWFDFYFNGCELDLENAPLEYKTILEKVRNLQ